MNRRIFWGFLLLAVGFAWPASATSTILVGEYALRPNRAGQQVQVMVSGGDAVQGVNLFVQLADGGVFAGGTATGPIITGVNITSGTIFTGNNTGARGGPDGPLFWEMGTTTATGTVTTQGLLATITIDTTGIFGGSFPLTLNPALAASDFADPGIVVAFQDGNVNVLTNTWHYVLNPLDVNADTLVNALDVLQIVNELNANGTRDLELPVVAPAGPPPYYDVSGDTMISPLDVLQVVNYINDHPPQAIMQGFSGFSPQMLSMAAAVPEPSSIALLASTFVSMLLAWRLRR